MSKPSSFDDNDSPVINRLQAPFLLSAPLWLWLLVAAVFGGVVGLGGFTFVHGKGGSYISDNPETCINCHIMQEQFDRWINGSHTAVATCNDCHTPHTYPGKYIVKGINGWNHSVAFTTGDFHEPIRINEMNREVTQQACIHCHGSLVTAMSHLESDSPTDCLSCHAGVGHGR